MNGQDFLVLVALIGAAAYLFVRSRRAHALVRAQSRACSRCLKTGPDRESVSPSAPAFGTVNRPPAE